MILWFVSFPLDYASTFTASFCCFVDELFQVHWYLFVEQPFLISFLEFHSTFSFLHFVPIECLFSKQKKTFSCHVEELHSWIYICLLQCNQTKQPISHLNHNQSQNNGIYSIFSLFFVHFILHYFLFFIFLIFEIFLSNGVRNSNKPMSLGYCFLKGNEMVNYGRETPKNETYFLTKLITM